MKLLKVLSVLVVGFMLMSSVAFAAVKNSVHDPVDFQYLAGTVMGDVRVVTNLNSTFAYSGTYWWPTKLGVPVLTPIYKAAVQSPTSLPAGDPAGTCRTVLSISTMYQFDGTNWNELNVAGGAEVDPIFTATGQPLITSTTNLSVLSVATAAAGSLSLNTRASIYDDGVNLLVNRTAVGGTVKFNRSLDVNGTLLAPADITNWNTAFGWGDHSGLYTPIAHQTTEDAISGILKIDGAGGYSAALAGSDYVAAEADTLSDVMGRGATAGQTMILTNTSTALTIGNAAAGIDYVIAFNGETNQGALTYFEDENRFVMTDMLYVNSGAYYAQLGDAASTRAGYFYGAGGTCTIGGATIALSANDGTRTTTLGNGADGINSTDGTRIARLVNAGFGGYFTDGTRSAYLATGTYALSTAGNNVLGGAVVVGLGTAGIDYTLTFDGETSDGQMQWMEDEGQLNLPKLGDVNIGNSLAGTDYSINFWGETNDASIKFWEDEATLSFGGSMIGMRIASGTDPSTAVGVPQSDGALFLDTDASANGSIYCYGNGSWRKVVDLP